jgi:hypothetical protein
MEFALYKSEAEAGRNSIITVAATFVPQITN